MGQTKDDGTTVAHLSRVGNPTNSLNDILADAVTTEPMPAADYSLYQQIRLEVIEGPDAGSSWLSSGDRMDIGTHASADVTLTDTAVSRFHFRLTVIGERISIVDLDSRNGTRVNDVSVAQANLGRRAVIRVGRSVLRFERVASQVKVPLSRSRRFQSVVGTSPAMRRVFALLERLAEIDLTVLLGGETGTGKDAIARAIHDASPRQGGPLVVVDCGAISHELIESELFGHVRGAFTGAELERCGAFEHANGGTLFLDEIGEMPLDLQPKLLRVLESRTVRRVGSSDPIPVDIRVIAATNKDLRAEVNKKRFRTDLFYRLAVAEIQVPNLRDRLEDLPLLIEALLAGMGAADNPVASMLLAPDVVATLEAYAWPGNVRELRNYLERCIAMQEIVPISQARRQSSNSLPSIDPRQPLRAARETWIDYFERHYLRAAIEHANGNISGAARNTGIDRAHFYRLLEKRGLR